MASPSGTLTDAVGFVEEIVAVAQRLLCVLVNRNGDRLDMLIAVAFTRGTLAQFSERVEPRRVVRLCRRTISIVRASPTPAAKHAPFR
jgi:hypothetical protein